MMYCPNCGQRIADNSKFCQFCGSNTSVTKQNIDRKFSQRVSKKPRKKLQTSLMVVFVAVTLLIFALVAVGLVKASKEVKEYSDYKKTYETTSNGGKFNDVDAFTCAEDIVRQNLKAPSTAKFCKITEATCQYDSATDYWTVKGWVDAENSFGAMIRQNWTAKFQPIIKGNDIGYTHGTCTFN